MKKWTILLTLFSLAGIQSVLGQQQVARVLDGNGDIGGYYEYLPEGYNNNTTTRYPLLVFFHGIGEDGNGTTDITKVLRNGPPRLINEGKFPKSFTVNGQTFSFIVISPQTRWLASNDNVVKLINTMKEKYRVDDKRIYVTGLSRGGQQVWELGAGGDAYAKIPAAIVPVCGSTEVYFQARAASIARNNLPVWATHNRGDGTVPVGYTENWIKSINANIPAPNPLAKMTIFEVSGHDAWTKTYDPNFRENSMNVYEWMLQYQLGGTVTPPPPPPGNKRITLAKNYANGIRYTDAMSQLNIQPGDTLCIPAGDYSTLELTNVVGTADKPVVIQNCGGLVRFGINNTAAGGTTTVAMAGVKFIEFSGSGTPGLEYGFDIKGSNDAGQSQFAMFFFNGATDFDVHNVYIHDAGTFIEAKTTQTCTNTQFHYGNYVMRNVKIHKIKGRNSEWEGFYLGNSHFVLTETCGDIKSHQIENIDVYDNDLENTGQDGIQLSMASLGTNKIRNNRLVNYGMSKNPQHSYGILVGGASRVDVSNNLVDRGYSAAVCVFGTGISRVFNNVLSNVELEGIHVADRLVFDPTTAYIYNNTILNTGDHAVINYGTASTIPHLVYNNLTINKGTQYDEPLYGYYIKAPVKYLASNNINFTTIDQAGFVNAAGGDYHLLATSKAIDAGRDMADQGLTIDKDNKTRPYNGKFDVGAYEFYGSAPPPNTPPVANAGANATITLPADSVVLDGSVSSDADGTIAAWSWKKIGGPAAGTIATPAAAKTKVTGLTEGTYVFALTVTDNAGGTATANVTITVNAAPVANKLPVANAGNGITITLPTNGINLDGSASTDPDGSITSWSWTKKSGPSSGTIGTPNAAKTGVTGLVEGMYVFTLTVTDNSSATASADVTVTVNAAPAQNTAPVAHAGFNTTIVLPVNSTTLDGSASQDMDGTIAAYSWKLIGGPAGVTIASATTAKTQVTGFTLAGAYVFELTVTDDKGATNASNVTITVQASASANKPPVANAGPAPVITLPVSVVTVDGSGSSDADGTITAYRWTKVSGPRGGNITAATAAQTTIYDLYIAGEYYFQLRVTDNSGDTASALVKITVNLPENKPPVARAGNDVTITLPASSVVLDGSSSTDEDGTVAAYQWKKISGPAAGTIGSPAGASTTVSGLTAAGTYEYELTVTDNSGASASDRVLVTVLATPPPANKPPVARAGNDITITLPTNSVVLDGRASTDEDGSVAAYQWKKISGPAAGAINTPAAGYTTVSGLTIAGTYEYELTVTDNSGAAASDRVLVTVLPSPAPANKLPVANAGTGATITLPTSSASLDGRGSTDEDGTIASYHWKKISGPAAGSITTADGPYTSVTGLTVAGQYVFELTVTDNASGTATATVTITVNAAVAENTAPVAATQGDVVLQLPNNIAQFDGSASKDADGTIVSYEWKQLSGPTHALIWDAAGAKTTASGFERGEYIFQLTVRDDKMSTSVTSFKVSVLASKDGDTDTTSMMPNPATTYTRLDIRKKGAHQANIYILELSGRVVRQIPVSFVDRLQTTIDVQALPKGLYMVSVKGQGLKWTGKLMVTGL